jgi:hypothetical protein
MDYIKWVSLFFFFFCLFFWGGLFRLLYVRGCSIP